MKSIYVFRLLNSCISLHSQNDFINYIRNTLNCFLKRETSSYTQGTPGPEIMTILNVISLLEKGRAY